MQGVGRSPPTQACQMAGSRLLYAPIWRLPPWDLELGPRGRTTAYNDICKAIPPGLTTTLTRFRGRSPRTLVGEEQADKGTDRAHRHPEVERARRDLVATAAGVPFAAEDRQEGARGNDETTDAPDDGRHPALSATHLENADRIERKGQQFFVHNQFESTTLEKLEPARYRASGTGRLRVEPNPRSGPEIVHPLGQSRRRADLRAWPERSAA